MQRIGPDRRIEIPVNIFETTDAFIIHAFVPYHKPNAMKVTVSFSYVCCNCSLCVCCVSELDNGDNLPTEGEYDGDCT
jgi:hypothetical protein